jgi:8-oxo-dGTP pyrophosphatase MutT (NUDIX family)
LSTTLARAQAERAVKDFPRITVSGGRRAAVAIAVVRHHGRDCMLLTLRAASMRAHAGQYALPGGKLDERESAVDAALRETHEELGIDPGTWRVLGELDDFETGSGSVITPVVLVASRAVTVAANPAEVAEAFIVALPDASPALRWIDADAQPFTTATADIPPAKAIDLAGHTVFAPTGAIIHQFLELWLAGRVTRVHDIGEPRFAAT